MRYKNHSRVAPHHAPARPRKKPWQIGLRSSNTAGHTSDRVPRPKWVLASHRFLKYVALSPRCWLPPAAKAHGRSARGAATLRITAATNQACAATQARQRRRWVLRASDFADSRSHGRRYALDEARIERLRQNVVFAKGKRGELIRI